ncbi:MAG: ATP-binding protein, partial [Deferribacteraceae bacterium]|nr:ATP-binding protein [Deferribacteraceae bacterium]
MRQIAYWLNNKMFAEILLRFCEIESLGAIDLSQPHEEGSYVFFLTDDEAKLKEYLNISDAPCFINAEARFSHSYYILSDKFDLPSLRLLMDSIHHGGTMWNTVCDVDFLTLHKKLKVSNTIVDEIERFVIMNTWELLFYCPFSDVEKIRIGFSEMLMNAIEHGNLGITEDEKHESTEEGTYHDLLAKRLVDPLYKDRQVRITIELTEGRKKKQPVKRLTIAIKDEG